MTRGWADSAIRRETAMGDRQRRINDPDTVSFATVLELARQIRAGQTTPTQLAGHFIARLETVGRRFNAVVTVTRELALEQARQAEAELAAGNDRGPLHGIPYGAKDLLATAGIPTSWGAAPFQHQVFDQDAAVIERLREAGAVLVAKLAMVECAGGFGYEQPNASFTGPGKSAWNEDAWSGGSSSGSGSAVGAGCVPFAIGSETWGSILTPATFNGLSGLRPTYGRVSRRGAMALSWTMDKIGPMARTANDCWAVLAAIAGPDPGDPTSQAASPIGPFPWPPSDAASDATGFRFAVLRDSTSKAQPDIAANFEASVAVLRQIGSVEEVDLPDLPWDAAASVVVIAEGTSAFEEFITSGDCAGLTALEDRVGLYQGLTLPAVDYLRALRIRRVGSRQLDALLAPYDAVVAPTLPQVATPIDAKFATWFGRDRGPSLGAAGNLCGVPSITVPNGFGERGLPTALEFMGRAFGEERILAAARAYQARTDWHTKHPDLETA
jgi:aspartyl-tRNA(Asn)/glutamyl-tRNA(Gln) amidotransferase subunit A